MLSWMNSEGHKANILSVHSTEIGIGTAYVFGGRESILERNFCVCALHSNVFSTSPLFSSDNWWVQTFGRRDAYCGSGVVDASEECDDKNRKNGDGCSDNCKTEQGFACVHNFLNPISICNSADSYVYGDDNQDPNQIKWFWKRSGVDGVTSYNLMAIAGYLVTVGLFGLGVLSLSCVLVFAVLLYFKPKLKVMPSSAP